MNVELVARRQWQGGYRTVHILHLDLYAPLNHIHKYSLARIFGVYEIDRAVERFATRLCVLISESSLPCCVLRTHIDYP
jgi:hypothetical protein